MEVNVIDLVGKDGCRGRYARSDQKRRLKSHVDGRATSREREREGRRREREMLSTALGGDGDEPRTAARRNAFLYSTSIQFNLSESSPFPHLDNSASLEYIICANRRTKQPD